MSLETTALDLYRDPQVFERERRSIFAKTWQFFTLASDFVRAGDYVSDTLAGFSIVVVRDAQGLLHGFHNVCPHRAGPLVGEGKGRCDRELVCKVHDWRFSFDGKLNTAPGFEGVAGFDPSAQHLFPIQVGVWRGFVFVNLDLASAPLAELLKPLDARLPAPIERPARLQHAHPVDCNWKIYVENYLDGSGVMEEAGPNYVELARTLTIEGEVVLHQSDDGRRAGAQWAWVWPNLAFSLYRGVLLIEHMKPRSAEVTEVKHIFLHEPEDVGVDAAVVASEEVTEDNAWICERIQQNLAAGVFTSSAGRAPYERAVGWFRDRVVRSLG